MNYPRMMSFVVEEGNNPIVSIDHNDVLLGWCYLSEYIEHLLAHPVEWKYPFRIKGSHLVYSIDNMENGREFWVDESYIHPTDLWQRFQNGATIEDIINR